MDVFGILWFIFQLLFVVLVILGAVILVVALVVYGLKLLHWILSPKPKR